MEKKSSTVEDDFESLFEEEAISTTKENKNLSFNDLFEAIAEESEELVDHRESNDQVDNVEEDFEALLSDEHESEVRTSDQSTKEVPNDLVKGFSQIFASENSPLEFDNPVDSQLVHGHSDHGHGDHGNQHDLTQGDDVQREEEMETVVPVVQVTLIIEQSTFLKFLRHKFKDHLCIITENIKRSRIRRAVENANPGYVD